MTIARLLVAGIALTAGLAHAAPPASVPPQDPCGAPGLSAPRTQGFVEAASRNAPAVVSVLVMRPRRDPMEDLEGFDFFQDLSGLPVPGGAGDAAHATQERSTSSGFIIRADGHILTSAHAVFDAQQTWVVLADGRRFQARVLGLDRSSDVALLKIDAVALPVVPLAETPRICAGEWVAALGAPFGFEHSVTVGVVSAYPRLLPGGGGIPLIQTDVVLNPGSSGGPLFNADGLVVGMNSMIFSANGIYIGVSFSLPIDRVMRIADEIRESGGRSRGYIGLRTQPVTPELARAFGLSEARGALVTRVRPGSPADHAGLRNGDILLSVDGAPFATAFELEESVASARPGATLALQIWRRQALKRIAVKVGPSPQDVPPVPPPPGPPEKRLGLELALSKTTAAMPAGVYVESASGSGLLAGLEPGDRITAINGVDVASLAEFDAALAAAGNSKVVALLVTRGSSRIYIPILRPGS